MSFSVSCPDTKINDLCYSTFIPIDVENEKLKKEINKLKEENNELRKANDKNKIIKEYIKQMKPHESFVLFYLKFYGFI